MEPYSWVSEGSITKFNRAVLEFRNKNKQLVAQLKDPEEITEERLKARYIEMNGLIVEKSVPSEETVEEKDKPSRGRPRRNQDAE
jgi:hypothetical protein